MSPIRAILLLILGFMIYRAVRKIMLRGEVRALKEEVKKRQAKLPPPPHPEPEVETIDGMDPHDVLGVKKGASVRQIRKAYQKLAAQHHPDKAAKDGDEARARAEKESKVINRAYEILVKGRGG